MTNPNLVGLPDPREYPTLSVPEAGRLFYGLSRASSYEAAARGDIPVIRLGRRMVVPTATMLRLVGLDVAQPAA